MTSNLYAIAGRPKIAVTFLHGMLLALTAIVAYIFGGQKKMSDISHVPDEIIEQVLLDISIMVENKYSSLLSKTTLFNLNKLESLLGAQFKIARQARFEGYMIQDCDMCSSWDKDLRYCNYYQFQQSRQIKLDYYYQALCPALTLR